MDFNDTLQKLDSQGIYLWGWAGQLNTGDDVFLAVVTHHLRKAFPNAEFFMDQDISQCTAEICGVRTAFNPTRSFPFQNRLQRSAFRKQCEALVLIGGSLFTSTESVQLLANDSYWTQGGKSILAFGVSVGPFESEAHEDATAQYISRMDFVAYRDNFSYEWALSKGLEKNSVRAFDLAFLFPELVPGNSISETSNQIGISLLPWRHQKGAGTLEGDLDFARNVGISLRKVTKDTKHRVTFFSLCLNPASDDRLMATSFAEGFGEEGLTLFQHNGDPIRTYEEIKRTGHFISMRLHGSILAFTGGVPFLQLEYHQKCSDFAETIGLSDQQRLKLFDFDPSDFEQKAKSLLNQSSNTLQTDLADLKARAMKNFWF